MSAARVVTAGAAPRCSGVINRPQIEDHSAPKGFEDGAATRETEINEVAPSHNRGSGIVLLSILKCRSRLLTPASQPCWAGGLF